MLGLILVSVASLLPLAAGNSAFFHPSMYGFNVTDKTFPFDSRPVVPLRNRNFNNWWFHGHLDFPPNDGDFFELSASKPITAEIAYDKGATSFFTSNPGGDIREPENPSNVCLGKGMEAYQYAPGVSVDRCGRWSVTPTSVRVPHLGHPP